ncbi:heavy metal translocating P-type ATPase [Rhodospirillum rubrum]|uniref:heavy metal translocating P-type ATPase n=1 Tax=Rhodospirillum rubrum TaxID=1085 RepID=UPI0019059293|nr:heavy metal translocating P-type ATPase metal-binding domain-containing protein [Rhodospirillum rubrum]MBK1664502.1 heavy metal translocating P-type ATPase [Rhodospirillum rubrum]MBK1676243.1 heavy metal translocating P-type ATPase [Rhodospirillum rubrum]
MDGVSETWPAGSAEGGAACKHCGLPVPANGPAGAEFCCVGCRGAYGLIRDSGLDQYYQRRCLDPDTPPPRPEDLGPIDFSAHILRQPTADGGEEAVLHLMVEGIHCAACVWLIETLLGRQPGVSQARLNMTTRRLTLRFRPAKGETAADLGANTLLAPVARVGYRLVPYDPALLDQETRRTEKALLQAMAVAGFASANVMLLSVSVWAGADMGPRTRDLMHWISALIAVPAVIYAVRPFAHSAFAALRAGRASMDMPITLAVTLATGVSLWETANGGAHAYFDAAVTLLFFLLIGRFLDHRARGRARSTAEHLLALGATAVTVLRDDGTLEHRPPRQVTPGATVLVATGERIGVDGTVSQGRSDVDTSLLTGETLPEPVHPGSAVFAGTLNLSGPLRLSAGAVGEGTLLAEIVRMMEVAEQGRARYVAVADRVARAYVPVVHALALASFLGWLTVMGAPWQQALMVAAAVLIVTCPCALALAVPVVQVVATGRLLRQGILVKSPTALERLTGVDHVVFDKTGTLTLGRPDLRPADSARADAWSAEDLDAAARLAGASHHPLARALALAAPDAKPAALAREWPGQGMSLALAEGEARLGRAAFCGLEDTPAEDGGGPELWFTRPGHAPVRFGFIDRPRSDAAEVVAALRAQGIGVELLSGDRPAVAAALAARIGLGDWRAGCSPADKVARLAELAAAGKTVLMVGDGLNDAPALAAAHVSLSPASAVDVTQTAADVVFQGERLAPVIEALSVARRADRLVRQNFVLSFAYNIVTVPLAICGLVTPLIAAVAMSSSSVVVILNALRLSRRR